MEVDHYVYTVKLGEISLHGRYYANSPSDIQILLRSILLEDVRSIQDICKLSKGKSGHKMWKCPKLGTKKKSLSSMVKCGLRHS